MIQTQTDKAPNAAQAQPYTGITYAAFLDSITFDGNEFSGVAVPSSVDSISPVAIAGNGSFHAVKDGQSYDGLRVSRKSRRNGTINVTEHVFIPKHMIRFMK